MAKNKNSKQLRKSQRDVFFTTLEYDQTEDAEDRLLKVYEFILEEIEEPETNMKTKG